ncbi:MAG TPA: 3'(2'),5'-bisphosphate nucleotidase CysQ [Gemmatimonadaceae bacterium]|nr:3'(2'),5'-bisphosphate nucleotidase CysQ [Gemmatimonadaceae bacterium]
MVNPERLMEDIRRLARDAGQAILRYYGSSDTRQAVAWKDNATPLTMADRDAHTVIADGLARLTPEIPVLSEEGDIPAYEDRRDWTRFWLVDPLDGTKEFTKGIGEFTVNIALIENGAPTAGVIYAPVLDLMYWARSGAGTWRQDSGASAERVYSGERPATGGRIIVQSRSHPSAELEAYLATMRVEQRISLGSSLKFCWVADGRADLYPRFGPTMEWDVAAGDCIYRESARDAGERRQTPFTYNKRELRNGSFVLGA